MTLPIAPNATDKYNTSFNEFIVKKALVQRTIKALLEGL